MPQPRATTAAWLTSRAAGRQHADRGAKPGTSCGDVSRPDDDDLVDAVSRVAPRFAIYRTRFESKLAAFRSGDTDALAKPLTGSYHDVWMELHEDLLATLGRERTEHDE